MIFISCHFNAKKSCLVKIKSPASTIFTETMEYTVQIDINITLSYMFQSQKLLIKKVLTCCCEYYIIWIPTLLPNRPIQTSEALEIEFLM